MLYELRGDTSPDGWSERLKSHGGGSVPEAPGRLVLIEDQVALRPFQH